MRMLLAVLVDRAFALGAAFGQDTNFASGPQYLMTHGSPLFAQPLSTPSLSLAGPPLEVGADNATARLIAGAENQTVSLPPADALPRWISFISTTACPSSAWSRSALRKARRRAVNFPPASWIPAFGDDDGTGPARTRLRSDPAEAAAYGKGHTGTRVMFTRMPTSIACTTAAEN